MSRYELKRQKIKPVMQRDPEHVETLDAPMLTLYDRGQPIGFVFDDHPSVVQLHRYRTDGERREILRWVKNEQGNQAMTLVYLRQPNHQRAIAGTDI